MTSLEFCLTTVSAGAVDTIADPGRQDANVVSESSGFRTAARFS